MSPCPFKDDRGYNNLHVQHKKKTTRRSITGQVALRSLLLQVSPLGGPAILIVIVLLNKDPKLCAPTLPQVSSLTRKYSVLLGGYYGIRNVFASEKNNVFGTLQCCNLNM